ncbi:f-box only protein [Anaeramoeba ignava]|uniref:F-box only protein n=1 Tax=Anaeramoeba ignava TaxID=1746090 RepID=A0A9Q0RDA0_ANAIG|nr:f-box only protein [Anaeramoeba ignava]
MSHKQFMSFQFENIYKFPKNTELIKDDSLSEGEEDLSLKFIECIPDEVLFLIFEYLDKPFHLGICSCVNYQFNKVAENKEIWQKIIKKNINLLDFDEIKLANDKRTFYINNSFGLKQYFSSNSKINDENFDILNEKNDLEQKTENLDPKIQDFLIQFDQNPKSFFVNQLKKYQKVKKKRDKEERKFKRKENWEKFKYFLEDNRYFFLLLLIVIQLWLISWKLESKKSFWILIFLPSFLNIISFRYLGFKDDVEREWCWEFIRNSLNIDGLILMFLSVKLDFFSQFPLYIIVMFIWFTFFYEIAFLFKINWIDFKWELTENLFIIIAILFHFLIGFFVLFAFLKIDYQKNFDWDKIFIPLFILNAVVFLQCFALGCGYYLDYTFNNITYWFSLFLIFLMLFITEIFTLLFLLKKWEINFYFILFPLSLLSSFCLIFYIPFKIFNN